MAIRKIVTKEDELIRKVCRPVDKFDERLWTLLDDMAETMYAESGYGLAAPQVGKIRRLAVIDVGEGLIELINPVITDTSEETQRDPEGCLSCPGEYGYVIRPMSCKVKAQDRNGNWFEKELSGLFCRCCCHECDHLDGRLFLDIADEMIDLADEE
ncbi:MAG: peptide deformylase [Oscillospiraceae bacterium]|jgi:peptide deformylase